jgi:hypothetical protein
VPIEVVVDRILQFAQPVKVPRRMRFVVISAKKRSRRLSQGVLVGVKCSLKRGCLASHAFTAAIAAAS